MEGKINQRLIDLLREISHGTERDLLATLTSRFFEWLVEEAQQAMDWAVEISIAKRRPSGITINNGTIKKLHQGHAAGFIKNCRRRGEPLCDEDVVDIEETLAMLMEAERHPIKLGDLNPAERRFIDECGGIIAEWQRTVHNGGKTKQQSRPHEGDRLIRILNFVIWWCRHEGKPPIWLHAC